MATIDGRFDQLCNLYDVLEDLQISQIESGDIVWTRIAANGSHGYLGNDSDLQVEYLVLRGIFTNLRGTNSPQWMGQWFIHHHFIILNNTSTGATRRDQGWSY